MGTTLADHLDSAIGDLLDLDPDTLTDGELHELVIGVQRQSHRLAAATRQADLGLGRARGVGRRRVPQPPPTAWPGRRRRRSRSAKVELRRARALRSMPHTATAVAAGDLSADHVDLLARANDGPATALFADHEATLVEQCQLLRYAQAHRMVEYWRQRADAAAAEDDADRVHAGRRRRWR